RGNAEIPVRLPVLRHGVLVPVRRPVAAAHAVIAHGLRPVFKVADAGRGGVQQWSQVFAAFAADKGHEGLEIGSDQASELIEDGDLALSRKAMASGRAVV